MSMCWCGCCTEPKTDVEKYHVFTLQSLYPTKSFVLSDALCGIEEFVSLIQLAPYFIHNAVSLSLSDVAALGTLLPFASQMTSGLWGNSSMSL